MIDLSLLAKPFSRLCTSGADLRNVCLDGLLSERREGPSWTSFSLGSSKTLEVEILIWRATSVALTS